MAQDGLESAPKPRPEPTLTLAGRAVEALHFLTALLLLAGCGSSIQTRHEMAPDANMALYGTYAWLDVQSRRGERIAARAVYVSPVDDRRIRAAVDAGLTARGFRKVDPAEADLHVTYAVGSEQRVGTRPSIEQGRWYYVGTNGQTYRTDMQEMYEYTEGSLAIELFERSSGRAVWVGQATKRLSEADDPDALIRSAVEAILEPLPAPAS